jgi:hypothetical protein
VGDSVEATVVGVMSIMAMAVGMATAGLHLPCTLPTGRVETIIPPTERAGTIIPPTGRAGTTLPTGTLETTTKAGAAGATRRLLMAVVGQGGSDRFRRIGCQKGAMVEAAGRAAVAMTGKNGGFRSAVSVATNGTARWMSSRLLRWPVIWLDCCSCVLVDYFPASVDLVKHLV